MTFVAGSISGLGPEMQKKGQSEGAELRPDTLATSPDLHEVNVLTKAKTAVATEESMFSTTLTQAERGLNELEQRVAELEAACVTQLGTDLVEGAFHNALVKYDHELVSACAAEMKARATLNGFRAYNSITTPARYPEDQLYHFALLIVFAVVETAVNAVFYEGSSGLVGGALVALGVSVVNMSIAAFLGYFFAHHNLPETKNKIIGYGSLVLFIVTATVLNLIFATFRVQYQLVELQAVELNQGEVTAPVLIGAFKIAVVEAFGVFQLHFPAVDMMSLLLFFIGLGCSVLAYWKGYTFDDRYPGHGQLDREHKKTELKFSALRALAHAAAVAAVNSISIEIERLRSDLQSEHRNALALKAQVLSGHRNFTEKTRTIQNELNLLIETYRAANRATRSTLAPGYFSEPHEIPPTTNGIEELKDIVEKLEAGIVLTETLAKNQSPILGERLMTIRQSVQTLVQEAFEHHLGEIQDRATRSLSK